MPVITVQQAQSLANDIISKRLDYENRIYQKLELLCPQISWYNRRQKADFLVDELIRLLPLVDNTYDTPKVAPMTITFLNSNMKLFEDFIAYEKKYPLIAECKLFRFRDTGNPNAGNQFGLYWLVIADSVEVVLNDGRRIAKSSGLQILSRPPMAPGEKITISAIYYGQESAKVELYFKDIIQEFSDRNLRDTITNWLLAADITYTSGMQLPYNLFIDGANIIHYGWWEASKTNLINLKDEIKNNPAKYEQYIFKKICKICPQLKYKYMQEKAKTFREVLWNRINSCKIENSKFIISPELIEFVSQNAYLFEDFFTYLKKAPLIIENQIFNFPGNKFTGLCWLANGGDVTITLPHDRNVTLAKGLKILSRRLEKNEEVKIKLTSGQYDIVIEEKLQFGRLINAFKVPRLSTLIKGILSFNGIEYSDGMQFHPGSLYNAAGYIANKYIYVSNVDDARNYKKYPLFSERILRSDTKNIYTSDFRNDYNISFEDFVRNTVLNINLYSGSNKDDYIPVVDDDIDKVSQWIDAICSSNDSISFKVARELLIRLRVECSVFPVGIKTDDFSMFYNPESGAVRNVEIKDGNRMSNYTFGSKGFWNKLNVIEQNDPGKALDEFKRFVLDDAFALQIYDAWKSEDWETFFGNYLMIGFKPESAAVRERKIVHISDLHIGKNGENHNMNNVRKTITNIIDAYKDSKLKPIVVVTGDVVDFGYRGDDEARNNLSIKNFNDVFGLFSQLWSEGFKVIMLPGNHDYSEAIGADDILDFGTEAEITAIVTVLTGGTGTAAIVAALEGAKYYVNNYLSPEEGYKSGFISGITYSKNAKQRYENQAAEYLKGWKAGSAYEYRENYLRSQKSLSISVIDNQDMNKDAPFWADAFQIGDDYFLGNGDFRLARGYVNETQRNQLNKIYSKNDTYGCTKVLCMHNWVNYYPHALPQLIRPICIDLFNLVLNKAASPSVNYDGTKVKCWDVGVDGVVHEPLFYSFFYKLFEYVTKNNIVNASSLENFLNSIQDGHRRPQIVDLSWPLFREMYVPDPPKKYFSNVGNPNIIDDHDTHKITNEKDLFPFLEQSDLFMVGHRHCITDFVNYTDIYNAEVENCINRITQEMNSPQMIQNKQRVTQLRSTLTQNARNLNKDPRQLLMDFFKGLDIYIDSNQKALGDRVFGQICDYLVTNTFTVDINLERNNYLHAVPRYYSEINDAANNKTWREITIDLETGTMKVPKHLVNDCFVAAD